MHLKKYIKVFSLLIVISILLISLIPSTMATPHELSIGEFAPNFDIVNIESNESSQLSDYLGKVVILDLFATWCGPCIAAIPYIIRIQNSYNASDLEIISIDVDKDESFDKVVSFAERNNMSWTVSLDESNMSQNYGTEYIPTMYIINQTGFVVYAEIGFDYSGVITALDELIEADSTAPTIQNLVIIPKTSTLSFENNLVNVEVSNITDDFAVEEVYVNVTNSGSTKLYPVKQLETGGLNVTLAINPIQLFNTESVEVCVGAKDYRGNINLSPSIDITVELVSEDNADPVISSTSIESSQIPEMPSKRLYIIQVVVTDDTYVLEVGLTLKEERKSMGYIVNNITRSTQNSSIFIASIVLSDTQITNPDNVYVEVTATDVAGKITTYSSLSPPTSESSPGFAILLTILSLIGTFLVMKKRRVSPK